MYISRVEIDINDRRKTKNLTHVGAFHHWVEDSFPEEIKLNERSRKLWRIDKLNGKTYLLVISPKKPNLNLLEKYGVNGSAQTKIYDKFLHSLKQNSRMRFKIALNPVVTLSKGSGKRGITKPHVTIEHQMKYLMDRSEKNGFLLNENEFFIVERGYEIFKKTNQKPIKLVKVVYEGVLTIKEVSLFRKMLTEGFGKHKAYGFGMMTVIPVVE